MKKTDSGKSNLANTNFGNPNSGNGNLGNTKLGPQRIHTVRTRGGNKKYRALRLDTGNFSWGSESIARKTRIIDIVYNAANNELVRTKTLVKNAIVVIDATPFRQWYEAHYATPLGHKKGAKLTEAEESLINKKRSRKTEKKYLQRQKEGKVRYDTPTVGI